ncbi:MAG: GNAT family N-acetyltransferase [Defluviicoccus sp.]|nr:GNAT family N-acetyltransferase [Defluviicoccus sp.]MDE0386562.1 GNAT family N-acetyltransferase [Defluviicoccus sp.]
MWLPWRRTGKAEPVEGLAVRPARPGDGEAVAAMARALGRADSGRASDFTPERFRSDGFGADRAFETLVAEAAGGLLGYAIFYPGYDTDSASRGLYLADLYVREEFRRRGVGRALVQGLAAYGQERGARWMFWSVRRGNRRARRFYRALAPELTGVILCAAFGRRFELLAERGAGIVRRPD